MTATDRNAGPAQGLILAAATTMIVVTTCVALPIQPAIMRAFSGQPHIAELVSLVVVLPTLTLALSSIIGGVLGEWIERRKLLTIATAVFAVSAVLPVWLDSFALILVSRAVTGLALGVMMTTAVALTGDYYSGASLQRWLSAQGGASAIAAVIISAASGALGEISWRLAFTPLFVGAILLVVLIVVPAPKVERPNADKLASVVRRVVSPWTTWSVIFGLTVVSMLIVVPATYEFGVLLQEKHLGSAMLTGLTIAVLAGGAVVGAFGVGLLWRLSGPAKCVIAVSLACVGTVMIAVSNTLALMMSGAAIVGVGQGMLTPVFSMWVLDRTPEALRSRAVGFFQTILYLTLFFAPLLARWLAVVNHSSAGALRLYAVADVFLIVLLCIGIVRSRIIRPQSAVA